jgi:hypothetical protein
MVRRDASESPSLAGQAGCGGHRPDAGPVVWDQMDPPTVLEGLSWKSFGRGDGG